MEDELLEAKSLYESNLASIEEALATDPDNTELRQVQEELISALDATICALHDITATATTAIHRPQQSQYNSVNLPRLHTNPTKSHISNNKNNNARIHPRNLYSTSEPDFSTLAQLYPSLQPYLLPLKQQQTQKEQQQQAHSTINNTGNTNTSNITTNIKIKTTQQVPSRRTIDFSNPAACRELTKILLKSDFGVNWDLPEGHLVPPVTNRLNYILWIEDLLNLSSPIETDSTTKNKNNNSKIIIKGLDIGCGASCIYPLLGSSLLNWHFVGVDVTFEAIEWARKNVEMNEELKNLIEIRKVEMQPEQKQFLDALDKERFQQVMDNEKEEEEEEKASNTKSSYCGILGAAFKDKEERFAFSVCNPPFFERMEDSNSNPSTAFGGTAAESVYPGGEEAFVRNMYEDSLLLKDKVHWFTTMVGKKVTLKALRKWLHAEPSVRVVRTTEFFQGQTSRWGVAWSFVADPSVALKPIERGVRKRAASTDDYEEEKVARFPSLSSLSPQQQQQEQQQLAVKKRKITGRSVSIHIALQDSHAALQLLNHIKSCLEISSTTRENLALQCSLDISQYQLIVEPCESAASSSSFSLGATGFTVQLLAQQAKRYVLTIALRRKKSTAGSGSGSGIASGTIMASNTMDWFSEMVAEIETSVVAFGAQLIS